MQEFSLYTELSLIKIKKKEDIISFKYFVETKKKANKWNCICRNSV